MNSKDSLIKKLEALHEKKFDPFTDMGFHLGVDECLDIIRQHQAAPSQEVVERLLITAKETRDATAALMRAIEKSGHIMAVMNAFDDANADEEGHNKYYGFGTRLQDAIAAMSQPVMGDASTRKDEDASNRSEATPKSPVSPSEISDTEAELSLAISCGISLVAAGWTIQAAVNTTLERIRPYLRTTELAQMNDDLCHALYPGGIKHTQQGAWHWMIKRVKELVATREPVSVSLEKCAIALALAWGHHPHTTEGLDLPDYWTKYAKAVLDAAGVKYE